VTGVVPPDGYLGGERTIGAFLADVLNVPAEAIGEYMVFVEVGPEGSPVDIIASPGLDLGQAPAALRSLADHLDQRAARLLS
jgi:hypothetical protein